MTIIRRICRSRLAGAAALALATVGVYSPVFRAGFVWDDDSFLTANPLIKAPDGLYRIWIAHQGVDYWPLTSTVMWIQWRLWGMHPAGYHLTNLLLHVLEVLLVWKVLDRLRIPGAWLAAVLFAVHPLNVESVAWITQSKNLLAMLFSLLSVLCFLQTRACAPEGKGSKRWYGLSLGSFTLAMLAKASAATLSLVLLGILAWRRRLVLRDGWRMIPFLAVGAGLAAVSVEFQRHATDDVVRNAGWLERAFGAGAALWFYLFKAVLPVHLAFIYPLWIIRPSDPRYWLPLLAAVGLTALLWRWRKSGSRPLLFAWGYFCVALLPALGFAEVYFMKYSLVANHYEHFALIGVAAAAAAGWARWRRSPAAANRVTAPIAAAAVVGVLAVLTWRQCRFFADAETLYRRTLTENPSCWMAYNNLGILVAHQGHSAEALHDFEAAVALNPSWPEARFNLGAALDKAGRRQEAAAQYEQALQFQPSFRKARLALAEILSDSSRTRESVLQYQLALAQPPTAALHSELADLFRQEGRAVAARAEYEEALRLDSHYRPAQEGLRQLEQR